MFGQDKSSSKDTNNIPDESIHGVLNDTADQPDQSAAIVEPVTVADPDPAAVSGAAAPTDSQTWQHPGTPLGEDTTQINDVISPAGGFPRSTSSQAHDSSGSSNPKQEPLNTEAEPADDVTTHQLIDIKQHALEELEPLIDQLDQSPEEKFRTIMMMIQASDDQSLVTKAYQAAHSIESEKVRAQALLDIVNEINYFTQQPEG